jgi:hypothetical protein
MGITFHALKSVRECEGINPHIPKGASTLGIEVSVDSKFFRDQLQGSTPNRLKIFSYH